MPHVILEHSANLVGIDYQSLFSTLYQSMKKIPHSGTFKMRAISQENYYIGTQNEENAFVSLRVLMMPKEERTDQFKEHIAKDLIPLVKQYIEPVKEKWGLKCYPTVEIGELSKHYFWITDES